MQLTWFRFWIGYASIGGMTEWFMGLVLKTSAGQPAVGSNPTPSASVIAVGGTIPQATCLIDVAGISFMDRTSAKDVETVRQAD